MRKLWDLFEGERALFFTGLFGLGLSAVCFAAMAYHGVLVEPEGHLEKAATFDGAEATIVLRLLSAASLGGLWVIIVRRLLPRWPVSLVRSWCQPQLKRP